jgi:hypothetical protein
MRTTAFAIALLIGGAAVAQTTTVQTTTQPDVDVDADVGIQPDGDLDVDADVDVDTKTTTTVTTHDPAVHGTTTHTTTTMAATTTPASGAVVQPGNTAPERDARGIAVISDPAAVPAGFNGVSGTAVGGPMVDPATGQAVGAEASYPACTASVTDNCVQTYERGRPR